MPIAAPDKANRDADRLAVAPELTQHRAQQDRAATFGGAAADFYRRN